MLNITQEHTVQLSTALVREYLIYSSSATRPNEPIKGHYFLTLLPYFPISLFPYFPISLFPYLIGCFHDLGSVCTTDFIPETATPSDINTRQCNTERSLPCHTSPVRPWHNFSFLDNLVVQGKYSMITTPDYFILGSIRRYFIVPHT